MTVLCPMSMRQLVNRSTGDSAYHLPESPGKSLPKRAAHHALRRVLFHFPRFKLFLLALGRRQCSSGQLLMTKIQGSSDQHRTATTRPTLQNLQYSVLSICKLRLDDKNETPLAMEKQPLLMS